MTSLPKQATYIYLSHLFSQFLFSMFYTAAPVHSPLCLPHPLRSLPHLSLMYPPISSPLTLPSCPPSPQSHTQKGAPNKPIYIITFPISFHDSSFNILHCSPNTLPSLSFPPLGIFPPPFPHPPSFLLHLRPPPPLPRPCVWWGRLIRLSVLSAPCTAHPHLRTLCHTPRVCAQLSLPCTARLHDKT